MKEFPNFEVLNPLLISVFPNLNKANTEVFVNLIQGNSNESDFIGEIETSENLTIPLNSITYIKCKFKTETMVTKILPVIFQSELNMCMDLVITENCFELIQEKSKSLKSRFTTRPVRRLGLRIKHYWDI